MRLISRGVHRRAWSAVVAALALVAVTMAAGPARSASADATPAAGTTSAGVAAAATTGSSHHPGYWLISSAGNLFQFGTTNFGDLTSYKLAKPIVGGATTSDGLGYWMVASDGGIFSFGDAAFHGSTGSIALNRPIVGMAVDPATGGYWLVASDGGIFAFDAPFFGSTGAIALNKPVVGMAATPDGRGYWLVASDGGVFAFGDAAFYGSTGAIALNKPVVGMAATPDGRGYWMTASDGGIFAFGDAGFHGSTGSLRLVAPITSMSPSPDGGGYWLVASDGGVFTFGDAPYLGSAASVLKRAPIVSLAETDQGYPFPPGATGYDVSQYQCPDYPGHVSGLPTQQTAVAVVQVSGGALTKSQPTQCYQEEAAWAGANMSAYIFMNPLPSPAPTESMTGPAGNCAAGDTLCEGYNFGYYWAQHWVQYSKDQGTDPTLWWLDVETSGGWDTAGATQPTNARVIAGAVAGLQAAGMTPGIYATNLQWGEITGYGVSFPDIALWIPGAGNATGSGNSAESFCSLPSYNGPGPAQSANYYSPFAGGRTVLVQYGYAGYSGPKYYGDADYACI